MLLRTVEEIRSAAEDQGFVVFYGWAQPDEGKSIDWDQEHGGGWKNFLKCAKSLDIKSLYLHWVTFSQSHFDDALKTDQGDSVVRDPEIQKYNQEVENYRHNIGLTNHIDLAFLQGGLVHICEIYADWFDAFLELTTEDEEGVTQKRIDNTPLIHEWGRKLAVHPKYGNCKSNDDREYLLQSLSGENFARLPHWEIVRHAESVYNFEIKEAVNQELREKVRALKGQGFNINAIALELGISRHRVEGLLGGMKQPVRPPVVPKE